MDRGALLVVGLKPLSRVTILVFAKRDTLQRRLDGHLKWICNQIWTPYAKRWYQLWRSSVKEMWKSKTMCVYQNGAGDVVARAPEDGKDHGWAWR
jgi:hypothetical protein